MKNPKDCHCDICSPSNQYIIPKVDYIVPKVDTLQNSSFENVTVSTHEGLNKAAYDLNEAAKELHSAMLGDYIEFEDISAVPSFKLNNQFIKKGAKNPYYPSAEYDSLSRKDLVGVIRGLLEELGRTTVPVPSAGATFIAKDTVVSSVGKQRFISFRGLIDEKSDEKE